MSTSYIGLDHDVRTLDIAKDPPLQRHNIIAASAVLLTISSFDYV